MRWTFLAIATLSTPLWAQDSFHPDVAAADWLLRLDSDDLHAPTPVPPCDSCGFGSGSSFVYTLSGETLPAGRWHIAFRADWHEFSPYSDAELLAFSAQGVGAHSIDRSIVTHTAVAHGIDDNLTLAIDLPYVHHENLREAAESGPPDFESNGDQNGLGDMAVIAQYCFHRDAKELRYASIYAGARLPTGVTDLKASDGSRLEADHQPGSGSVDPFVGLGVAQGVGSVTIGASVVYSHAGHGSQDSDLGDVVRLNGGIGYQFDQADDAWARFRIMLELSGEWRERARFAGETDPNTGGLQLFVSPGCRVLWKSGLSWFLSVGVPIVEDLNGEQADTKFRLASGIGISF